MPACGILLLYCSIQSCPCHQVSTSCKLSVQLVSALTTPYAGGVQAREQLIVHSHCSRLGANGVHLDRVGATACRLAVQLKLHTIQAVSGGREGARPAAVLLPGNAHCRGTLAASQLAAEGFVGAAGWRAPAGQVLSALSSFTSWLTCTLGRQDHLHGDPLHVPRSARYLGWSSALLQRMRGSDC